MVFEKYPFEKLNELLDGIEPNSSYEASALTIGEPQFETPQFIQDSLANHTKFLRNYPKTAGENFLTQAMIEFVNKRFDVKLEENQIIPCFGTREVLFNFPQFFFV